MESETLTLTCGKKHSVPSAEKDIRLLENSYIENKLHIHNEGRSVKKDDIAKDIVGEGFDMLQEGKIMK